MRNAKSACAFEHDGFKYVCNFDSMIMWMIADSTQDEDDDPVTVLDIRRSDDKSWQFKGRGGTQWMNDGDHQLAELLEKHFNNYLNEMIVGRYGRLPPSQTHNFRSQSIRAVDKPS